MEWVTGFTLLWEAVKWFLDKIVGGVVEEAATRKIFAHRKKWHKGFETAQKEAMRRFLSRPGPRIGRGETLEVSFADEEFARAVVGFYIFNQFDAKDSLPWLYKRAVALVDPLRKKSWPAWDEFESTLREFMQLLRDQLLQIDDWRDLLGSVSLQTLTNARREGERGPVVAVTVEEAHPNMHEIEQTHLAYCDYMSNRYGRLEFAGISSRLLRGEEKPLLEKIFVDVRFVPWSATADEPTESDEANSLTFTDAIEVGKPVVLVGSPGGGKSTLVNYLAWKFANVEGEPLGVSKHRLPIIISLGDFAEKRRYRDGYTFVEYCHHFCEDHFQMKLPRGFFQHYLRNGETIVFFDGLDEIPTDVERSDIRDAISSFVALGYHSHQASPSSWQKNLFIVTTRHTGYEGNTLNAAAFAHFGILNFGTPQIEDFVRKWYALREPSSVEAARRANDLLRIIQDDNRIGELASNPFLLTVIALIHSQGGELPNHRVKLYEESIASLLALRDERRPRLKSEYGEQESRRRLEYVAYWTQTQQTTKPKRKKTGRDLRSELVKFLRERLSDPNRADDEAVKFLDWVRARTGLLRKDAGEEYAFTHLNFQRYFAACFVVNAFYRQKSLSIRRKGNIVQRTVLGHLHNNYWHEVNLMVMAQLKAEDHKRWILHAILDNRKTAPAKGAPQAAQLNPFEHIWPKNLLFLAQCLADDVLDVFERESRNLRDGILDELFQTWRDFKPKGKHRAIKRALIAMRASSSQDEVVRRLVDSLGDMDETIRQRATDLLGKFNHPQEEAVRILIEDLSNESPTIQDAARRALEALAQDSSEVFHRLLEVAQTSQRVAALHATKAMLNSLTAGLRFVPEKTWIDTLLPLGLEKALGDSNRLVRYVSRVIEILSSKAPIDWVLFEEILSKGLADHSPLIRDRAAFFIGKRRIPSMSLRSMLATTAQHDETAEVRTKAIWALERLESGSTS